MEWKGRRKEPQSRLWKEKMGQQASYCEAMRMLLWLPQEAKAMPNNNNNSH